MILVTGGLGFIGSHTVAALVDEGEDCVLLQRTPRELPAELDPTHVAVEPGDVTDLASLMAIAQRHRITGIVHLAGSMPWPPRPGSSVDAARTALTGLLNVLTVAERRQVGRVGVASTIGVYGGAAATGALGEDLPLPLHATHPIPTFKKIGELLGDHLAGGAGLDLVALRISGTWGPRGHDDPFFAAPALVHAAARGTAPDLRALQVEPRADDALDLCYVKDTARAIALLQLSDHLAHRTYNVGSGRATSNAEVAAAITAVEPRAQVTLPAGGSGERSWLDITRLTHDTGFRPRWDLERAAADYIGWLRAGHPR